MGPGVTSGMERSSNPGWRWRLSISHPRDTMAGASEQTRAEHGPAADSAGANRQRLSNLGSMRRRMT